MGFSFRKSFKAGPLRINLSKRGLGLSAGVKGFRAGVNAQGSAYVRAEKGGRRYQKTMSATTPQAQPVRPHAGVGRFLQLVGVCVPFVAGYFFSIWGYLLGGIYGLAMILVGGRIARFLK